MTERVETARPLRASRLEGGPAFGARHGAGNPMTDIEALAAFAHRFHARVFVALNTILHDDELEPARRLAWQCWEAGVDALIVQDLGLLELDLPPIELHASTQCDIRTPAKLALPEIAAVRAALPEDVVVEHFVHGALCVAFSGQCYISHAHTGRSANRGDCSQACRLPYTLEDEAGRVVAYDRHLLSMKDNDQSGSLRALIDAGVTSFKIEGRRARVVGPHAAPLHARPAAELPPRLDRLFHARPARRHRRVRHADLHRPARRHRASRRARRVRRRGDRAAGQRRRPRVSPPARGRRPEGQRRRGDSVAGSSRAVVALARHAERAAVHAARARRRRGASPQPRPGLGAGARAHVGRAAHRRAGTRRHDGVGARAGARGRGRRASGRRGRGCIPAAARCGRRGRVAVGAARSPRRHRVRVDCAGARVDRAPVRAGVDRQPAAARRDRTARRGTRRSAPARRTPAGGDAFTAVSGRGARTRR